MDEKLVKLEEKIERIEDSMNKPDLFGNYKRNRLEEEYNHLSKKYQITYDKYIYYAGGNAEYSYT